MNEINIQPLKDAVARVRRETGEDFVFAAIEFGGFATTTNPVTFKVYRRGYHSGETLDKAVNAALAFDDKAEKLAEAEKLRAQADKLEREANK